MRWSAALTTEEDLGPVVVGIVMGVMVVVVVMVRVGRAPLAVVCAVLHFLGPN